MNRKEKLVKIIKEVNKNQFPVSVITNKFSDMDVVKYFEKSYNVSYLEDRMVWKDFREWFYKVYSSKSVFDTFVGNKPKRRMMIINTDMIGRIPKKLKKTKKSKKSTKKPKVDEVFEMIKFIKFKNICPVVFFSEKPIKEYRMQIKPVIVGDIIDYSDKLYVTTQIIYNNDVDEVIDILYKFSKSLEDYKSVMQLVDHHFCLYSNNHDAFRLFHKMKYEVSDQNVTRRFIASMFKLKKYHKVLYPDNYFSYAYKYNKLTPSLLKTL